MVKVLPCKFPQCFGAFTMLLFGGTLKWDFLDIDATMFFGVCNLGNTLAMRVIFFFENVQNSSYISKMQQKIQHKVFVFEVIASKLVALNCLY